LWRFVDGAKTAGELYGRALVVFAAEHYAAQLVLPAARRRSSVLPASHKDIARKAFERITKAVLPASHTQLQRALTAEARAYERSIDELAQRDRPKSAAAATAAEATEGCERDVDEDVLDEDDVDTTCDEDLDEDTDD
jgi:hypothetical protein